MTTTQVLVVLVIGMIVIALGPGTLWAERPHDFNKAVNYARDDIASARIHGGDR